MGLFLTVGAIFILLVAGELAWRFKALQGEWARKFVHITVGTFIAFTPWWLSWDNIRLLAVAFLAVIIFSKIFGVFGAIHSVRRTTYGEIWFAVSVGLITFLTQSRGIYAASILMMSLADGLAAVTGTQWGRKSEYKVFGQKKSWVGTGTFVVVAAIVLLLCGVSPIKIVSGSLLGALLENIAPFGLDNLLVPLAVCLLIK